MNHFFPVDIQCIVVARGRQQSLNSGISWTQHWRFGLCLHKGKRRHCKLFTGECRVTASCACLCVSVCVWMCVYNAILWLLWWVNSSLIETGSTKRQWHVCIHKHTCCLQLQSWTLILKHTKMHLTIHTRTHTHNYKEFWSWCNLCSCTASHWAFLSAV